MKENITIHETASIKFERIDDAYSKFSTDTNKVLDDSAGAYISESFKDMKQRSNKTLEIYLDEACNDEEKLECKKAIKRYFLNDYNDFKEENLKLSVISFALLLIGIVLIGILIFLERISAPYAITLILEIIAWVFVWEFVDVFVFSRFTNRMKMNRIKKILDAEIVFKDNFVK